MQLEYNSGNPRFYVGNGSDKAFIFDGTDVHVSSSNFTLDGARGAVTASDIKLSGNITATTINATGSGIIGGFTIDANEIADGTDISLSSQHKRLTINDSTFGNTGVQIEHNSGTPRFFAGKSAGGFVKFDGANFQFSSSGFILGQSGSLDASTGKFPDVSFISGSDSNIEISSSNFHLQKSGNVKVTGDIMQGKVTANEGSIGGFTIDHRSLQATNFFLDSPTAVLSLGTGTNAFGNANRIFLDGDNNAFSVGTQFKFDSTGLEVSGSSIRLGAPSFKLGSASNFISGSGGGLVIQSSGTTTLSGSAVTIETPKFFLGKKGSQFVSGSGGNIEISSSQFHLNPADNTMALSGSITATDGTIGGFTLGTNSFERDRIFQEPGGAFLTSSIEIKTGDGSDVGLPVIQLGMKSGSAGAGAILIAKGAGTDAGSEFRLGQMSNGVVQRQIYMTANTGSGGTTARIQTNGMSYGDSSDSGFYLEHSDANGDRFQIGSTSGAHLKFSSNDNLLYMSSSNFFLGGGGQFVSG